MTDANRNHDSFLETLVGEQSSYQLELDAESLHRLGVYFSMVNRWNPRLHLVAPCTPAEFATRHVLESLFMIRHLPMNATIADIGSGAGLPLIPCLIVRPDLQPTLIESAKKKAVFLNEALKATHATARVVSERFQEVEHLPVQFISCRAIDRFEEVLPEILEWAPPDCTFLLYGGQDLAFSLQTLQLQFTSALIPNSARRYLYVAART